MAGNIDGAVLKQRWDAACSAGAEVLRRYQALAAARGDEWAEQYLHTALGQLLRLQRMVNGHVNWPGRFAPGLIYDAPEELWYEPYTEAGETLTGLTELFSEGLGAPEWDWSKGTPPGWRCTWRDKVRALLPIVVE